MSLRRKPGYNRAEEKEEQFYWLDRLVQENWEEANEFDYDRHQVWAEFDYYAWMAGSIMNIEEYHQMKVLTLLRSFRLQTAREEAEYRGW